MDFEEMEVFSEEEEKVADIEDETNCESVKRTYIDY